MVVSRREALQWMAIAGGSLVAPRWSWAAGATTGAVEDGTTRWERAAAAKREMTKDVVWLTHEPIDFLIRRGDHDANLVEQYQRMVAPDNIKRMADAGIRYGRIFFYKGFGLEYERPHIEIAKRAADLMHQLGMQVSLYVGGTMFIETLYREVPEAQGWEQRDQWDQFVPYGVQTFRHYACPNEPAYRAYIKKVLKIGLEELHADQFAFDNIMLQAEPHSCRCSRCQKAFHAFLKKRYPTSAAAQERFGLPDTDAVWVNQWGSATEPDGISELNDPVLQEWVRFRCESLANYAGDFHDYVKSVNPDCDVLMNIKGVYAYNRYWTNAVYHPLFDGRLDALSFDTNGYNAHIDPVTGALVSQIRSYKMARKIRSGVEDPFEEPLRAAVHMAFGYQEPDSKFTRQVNCYGAHAFTPINEFFRYYNDRYYLGTENVADVAVLRNWPTMAFSISAAYVPACLMEQVLIQYRVPFDLLFDEQLEHLEKYRAVILAGQECVSDSQVELLLNYVRGGGTLIVTDNTGEYDERRAKRATNPLLPTRSEGKGRVVFIARIIAADRATGRARVEDNPEPGAALVRGVHMVPSQWVLPRNHREIYQQIVDGVSGGLSAASDAPLTTVMEMLRRPATRETILHFVNFEKGKRTPEIQLTVWPQFEGEVKAVTYFSAEGDDPIDLKFSMSGGRCAVKAPSVGVYGMVVVAQ